MLCLRAIGKIGAVRLASVDDVESQFTKASQDIQDGLDGLARDGHVVSHGADVAFLVEEVALHINDDQRRGVGMHQSVVWPGIGSALELNQRMTRRTQEVNLMQ